MHKGVTFGGRTLRAPKSIPMLPTTYVVILAVPTLNRGNKVYFHITHITFGGMYMDNTLKVTTYATNIHCESSFSSQVWGSIQYYMASIGKISQHTLKVIN